MSASMTCKPQQAGFFSRFRRTDSVMGSPTGSATPSLAPSLASLSQDNDNLAATNTRLQNRNQELMQQSELNQSLFQQTSEELTAKESEFMELKERFRDNAEATNETIQALGLQLQTLTEQVADLQDLQDKATDAAQDTATDRHAQLADLEEQQHQLSLEVAHVQSPTQEDVDDLIWAKLQDKNKTIHFLRCRQAKSDKRIKKLQERLEVEQNLGRDWVETIMMVNMKVRARAKVGDDADAGV
ncbi:uncharacterized protein J4E84_002015 [Alternaria hordeiaustralica]|uniref:uncharacterized protein n=1 Tax=Alternaria hordeiaustralica TaxID=1187925 RepID=UPI0020C38F22|nr:uncharacterized protein J4E84_002015 [Alternaria hordeiaustralica]KAI4695389.1 hypothetical protein J4E84_002015 [Alternaria hordeiaustralica]